MDAWQHGREKGAPLHGALNNRGRESKIFSLVTLLNKFFFSVSSL